MHFSGNLYRPPNEANSVMLQITQGCSHNKCKFCNMYKGIPFKISPMSHIEEDLAEIRAAIPNIGHINLLNADPLALSFDKIKPILEKINEYLPYCKSISMFASVSNIKNKTVAQFKEMRALGIDYLNMGFESGDDITLKMINKKHTSAEALEQFTKLDEAGIEYNLGYVLGLAGHGNGERNALESAKLLNQIHPKTLGLSTLTIFPDE